MVSKQKPITDLTSTVHMDNEERKGVEVNINMQTIFGINYKLSRVNLH